MPQDDPIPQPTEEDEHRALDFIRTADEAELRDAPDDDKRCGTCHFYADTAATIGYCWHPSLQIGVGDSWVCRWWRPHPGG